MRENLVAALRARVCGMAGMGLWLLAGAARAQVPSFAPVVTYGAGSATPQAVAIGDLNGDGRPDLAVANYGNTGTVGVLLATGAAGTYPATATTYGTGGASNSAGAAYVALADVNGDGRLDVVVGNDSNTVGVLLNSATTPGTFPATATTYATSGNGTRGVAVGDVNADGRPDIVASNYSSGDLSVLLGLAVPGTFGAARVYPNAAFPYQIDAVRLSDLNGDGRLDVAVINQAGTVGVLLNSTTAPGTFPTRTTLYSTGASLMRGLAVGDVNGDGRPDLVTTSAQSARVVVLLNQASAPGTFSAAGIYATGGSPGNPTLADVNGDGRLDLVVSNHSNNTVAVLLGQAAGTFGTAATFGSGGPYPLNVAVGDLDGDGRPDVAVTNYSGTTVGVLLSTTALAAATALPGATATLAPNPAGTAQASTTLTATGLPAEARQLTATLHDALGRELRRLAVSVAAGTTRTGLPTAGLPAGVYLLRLAAADAQGAPLGTLPTQRLLVE